MRGVRGTLHLIAVEGFGLHLERPDESGLSYDSKNSHRENALCWPTIQNSPDRQNGLREWLPEALSEMSASSPWTTGRPPDGTLAAVAPADAHVPRGLQAHAVAWAKTTRKG